MKTLKDALEEAFRVNMTLPPCPVTRECAEKYPQVDLWGKHSIIDTAFAYRTMLIEAACERQPDQVRGEAACLLEAARPQKYEMEQTASMLHVLELAGVLHDLSGSREYRDMRQHLMERPVLRQYHKSLTAVEHMAGLRETKISENLRAHCTESLGHDFSMEAYQTRILIPHVALEKQLPPPGKKNAALCAHYSNPATLKAALRKDKNKPAL